MMQVPWSIALVPSVLLPLLGGDVRSPLHSLVPGNPNATGFGYAVEADASLVVIGAVPWDTGVGNGEGSVHVFDAATGALVRDIANPDSVIFAAMGESIAVGGNTIIAGAPLSGDISGAGVRTPGAALLFDAQTGALLRALGPPVPVDGMGFGWSVSVSGSLAVVGARGSASTTGLGSAYVFNTQTGALIAQLVATDTAPWDGFGEAVAISGTTVVAGARFGLNHGGATGAAYLFDAITGVQLAKLVPSDLTANDAFGGDVAISGNTALVGAPGDDDLAFDSGAAYLFRATDGAQLAKLHPRYGLPVTRFGRAVDIDAETALVGNINGDPSVPNAIKGELFDARTGAQMADLVLGPLNLTKVVVDVAISGSSAVCANSTVWVSTHNRGAAFVFDATNPASPASTTPRNGSGRNAVRLMDLSGPVIGGSWSLEIDASGHAPSFVLLLVRGAPGAGVFLPAGELLLDPSSPRYLQVLALHYGGSVRLSIAIPPDSSLFGLTASAQAGVGGVPGLELSNAVDVALGY